MFFCEIRLRSLFTMSHLKLALCALVLTAVHIGGQAQMRFNGQQIFGNEWIRPGNDYYRILIAADGLYRLSYQQLLQSGIPVNDIPANQVRLHRFGMEVPLIASTAGIMTSSDELIFHGERNRAELDRALFEDSTHLFNREYSMFTDTAAYYLSWESMPSTARISKIDNDLSAPVPKDAYFLKTETLVFNEIAFKRGIGYGNVQKFPLFDACQGYSTDLFQSRSFSIPMKRVYTGGPSAKLNVTTGGFGEDQTAHKVNYLIQNQIKDQDLFSGYKVRERTLTIDPADLREDLDLRLDAAASAEDRISVSIIRYEYPHSFIMDQRQSIEFKLPPSPIRKYLELEDFNGGAEILVYDRTNKIYLFSTRESNGLYRITLPPSTAEREIVIWNYTAIPETVLSNKIRFPQFPSGDHDYMILYHPALTNDGVGNNYIQQYADYRSSAEGGSHRVVLVNVEDLYDLFAYGVNTHSLAVRNFMQYSRSLWPGLKHLFIIGKGLEYPYYRKTGRDPQYFFVPTFGSPAADMILATDNQHDPLVSFGRLPAISGDEIKTYLDKVRSHERYLKTAAYSLESREWLKRVVHLSGGDPAIYALISSQLAEMETEIESNAFGAHVETFYKQSSGAIEVANSELLKKAINEGSSIISFMGHSAAIRLDFNLENVDSYRNKDKYHLFMAMGCYAGAMFAPNRSISEEHNLASEKGSIIYLSNTTAGYSNVLAQFGTELYRQLGTGFYTSPVGDAMRETFHILKNNTSERLLIQAYSTSFNGDPAIRLNVNPEEDYTIDPQSVKTDPGLIFTTQSQYSLSFDLVNLGKHQSDSILLTIEKVLPDGSKSTVHQGKVKTPASRETYRIDIPVGGDSAIGNTTLYLRLDEADAIPEGPRPDAENNNELWLNGKRGFPVYVFGNEARPVYPSE
ncbi:MAG TPA: C25 family cysteine peptidase, partial [Saprospiraceae bacterium]|nr:C25 family cysteine peptidase [Saprospiraceae bacterium]